MSSEKRHSEAEQLFNEDSREVSFASHDEAAAAKGGV